MSNGPLIPQDHAAERGAVKKMRRAWLIAVATQFSEPAAPNAAPPRAMTMADLAAQENAAMRQAGRV